MAKNVVSWAPDAQYSGAYEQASRAATARGVVHPVALMPDAHVGIGSCVGAVIATEGTIIPAAVGVDIGCGMSAVDLNLKVEKLPDDLRPVLGAISKAVPAIAHQDSRRVSGRRAEALRWMADNPAPSGLADMGRAASQMGTLGGGNHFMELSVSHWTGGVWLVVHSGSRGVGNYLATAHIKTASAADKAAGELAAFSEGTAEFARYVADMLWAQNYAAWNRDAMLDAALGALDGVLPVRPAGGVRAGSRDVIRCHHNYAETENHGGRDVWVTRKGAIRARRGDKGIIPGSMGTSTFIVEGLGCAGSWHSASHGAGRVMSRGQAKREITEQSFMDAMRSRLSHPDAPEPVWQDDKAKSLVDEAPQAYKDIHEVMAAQSDLCRPVDRLDAVVNYKAG